MELYERNDLPYRPKRRKKTQGYKSYIHMNKSRKTRSCNVTNIQDLPVELLLQVFSYLSTVTLMQTVSKVCRQWDVTRTDPSLYRHLVLGQSSSESGPSVDDAIDLVQVARWVKKLHLVGRTDTNEILRHVRHCSLLLESLVLTNCRGSTIADNVSATCLISVLEKCSKIRHFKLKGSTYEDSPTFYNGIGCNLLHLRTVSLEAAKSLGSVAFLNLTKCRQLEEIRAFGKFDDMDNGLTSDEDMATLCSSLCNTLTVLKLNGWNWSDAAVKSLTLCNKLRKLHINDLERVTDEGIANLSQLPRLEKLSLVMCNNVSCNAWVDVFSTPALRRLQTLRLAMCSTVTDEVARAIARNCTALSKLMLTGDDGVSDVGLLALMTGCGDITYLDIHLMEPVVFNALSRIPDLLPWLTTLVYDEEWEAEFVEQASGVRERLPNLTCLAGSRRWDMYYNFVDSDD